MKKLILLLFVSIEANSFAQNIIDPDASLPPANQGIEIAIPGNNNNATIHGNYAYDTVLFVIINRYGFEDPANPGVFQDQFDTLLIQRKMSLGYGSKNDIKYKFVTEPQISKAK